MVLARLNKGNKWITHIYKNSCDDGYSGQHNIQEVRCGINNESDSRVDEFQHKCASDRLDLEASVFTIWTLFKEIIRVTQILTNTYTQTWTKKTKRQLK
jgi:hypothetical protein